MQIVKIVLQKILPVHIYNIGLIPYKKLQFALKIISTQRNHKKALKRVRKKEKIKAVFFLLHESSWKYDHLYKLMELDDRYDPVIILCPFYRTGEDDVMWVMSKTYNSFKKNGYNIFKSLNEETGQWLDVKKEIQPDIVFFTIPYSFTRPEYLIQNYLDTLTCYVPYGYKNSYLNQLHFNQATQNLVWKFFLETNIHQELSRKYSRNKGVNTVVTGYPGMDTLLSKSYIPKNVWKIKHRNIKRIIWAPHHTIPDYGATLDFSTFLKYCDFMLELAEKYKDQLQFAFKPHPILRANLSNSSIWGKQRTDNYYKKWEELSNGQLNEFEYLDLFITSDAMIHDCGSFSVEYLYTLKPVMFLINDESITDRYNEVGKMAFSKLYHGRNKDEIESFIVNTVLMCNDYKSEERIKFFNEIIKPPNGITASENIFNFITAQIFN